MRTCGTVPLHDEQHQIRQWSQTYNSRTFLLLDIKEKLAKFSSCMIRKVCLIFFWFGSLVFYGSWFTEFDQFPMCSGEGVLLISLSNNQKADPTRPKKSTSCFGCLLTDQVHPFTRALTESNCHACRVCISTAFKYAHNAATVICNVAWVLEAAFEWASSLYQQHLVLVNGTVTGLVCTLQ